MQLAGYKVSSAAMIVFFACVALAYFFGAGTTLNLVSALAAVVAAIALALKN